MKDNKITTTMLLAVDVIDANFEYFRFMAEAIGNPIKRKLMAN